MRATADREVTSSLPDSDAAAAGRRASILADVRDGLLRAERELPPKFFYDERGSQLFEEITRLPEYYLTRAEYEILAARASSIARLTNARTLVELGAGSATKTRVLLAALEQHVRQASYVPIDVSEDFLRQTGDALRTEFPSLAVVPVVADITAGFELPRDLEPPVLFAFLGSTIGNFEDAAAIRLLSRVRSRMCSSDWLLLGTDLRKDPAVLDAAYNDRAGVTAEFNRNMLRVLNAELGSDFVPERFDHRAFYNASKHRIEMHLVSIGNQRIHIPGIGDVSILNGDSVRTEVSYKYDRDAVDHLAWASGLVVHEWFTDSDNRFALSLLRTS